MLRQDRREIAAVFVGGALGTMACAVLSTNPGDWPLPTSIVNSIGAFLLGYFTRCLLERRPLSSYRRTALGTGLTTFSAMQVETIKMQQNHYYALAAGYTVASIAAGLLAPYTASALVRRVGARR